MTKSICALAHKPGSTRDDFQLYYEEQHVPLAIGYFPFSGYARNHIVGAADFRWDTISEFWADDIEKAAALMAGPIGQIMVADEERFMDRPLIASAGVEEIILSPGERASNEGYRTSVLVQAVVDGGDLRGQLLEWAGGIASDLEGVSVDFTTAWTEMTFPAKAVLWLPGWHPQVAVPRTLSVQVLQVRRIVTPSSQLLGGGPATA